MKNFPQNNTRFNIARKRSRSPAGPRRLGTATRMSASLSRRLSAFFGNTPDQAPKAAKLAVLIPGPGMFVNVQFVSRVMIAPLSETPRVCTCEPMCRLLRGRVASLSQRGISSRFWANLSKIPVRRKRSRRKALALFAPMPIHSSPQCELPQGFAGFGN